MKKIVMKAVGIISLIVLSFCFSCKLDETVLSEADPGTIYSTPEGIGAGVQGVYSKLRTIYATQPGYTMTTMGTDLFTHGKDGGFKAMDFYNPQFNASMSVLSDIWNNAYEAINGANTILAQIENVSLSEKQKNTYIAECRFLRAHFYYWLTVQFGDVVLTDSETQGVVTDQKRTPKEQIWKMMKADTEFAIEHLDWETPLYGKVTKGAALHQLSEILLLLKDYPGAEAAAKSVINNGPYKLLDNYADIFSYDNQQNSEIIFTVQYTKDPLNNGSGNQSHAFFSPAYDQFAGLLLDVIQGGPPYTRFRPTEFMANLYEKNDTRLDATFRRIWFYNNPSTLPAGKKLGDTVVWQISPGVISTIAPNLVNMHWSIKKYDDPNRASVQSLTGYRTFFVYRLSETYLIAAEALMFQGKNAEAAELVNIVRKRAAKPGTELVPVTAGQMNIDLILDERGREFAGEEMRWMDLARTGKLVERVKKYNPNGAPNIKDYHNLRPIPQAQIDLTTVDFPQNKGY